MNENKRSAPRYWIASISYWQGDSWTLHPFAFPSRDEAAAECSRMREEDFPLPIRHSRKYRIMTQTEVRREFGIHWTDRIRETPPAFPPLV